MEMPEIFHFVFKPSVKPYCKTGKSYLFFGKNDVFQPTKTLILTI